MSRVLVLVALVACGDPPPLKIKYQLTAGPDQMCMITPNTPAASCTDVDLPCAAHMSLRIIAPSNPSQAFVSVCKPIVGRKNLCSIDAIDLPGGVQISEQTLQVQVAIYPDSELTDLNGDGQLDCPPPADFSANGLPVDQIPIDGRPIPAIGGSAFYHPGDAETVVSLGCTSQPDLSACLGTDTIGVTATVIDFDSQVSVTSTLADSLLVSIGEPHMTFNLNEYVLNPANVIELPKTTNGPPPGWGDDIMATFDRSACLEVFEDQPDTTATLACKSYMKGQKTLDLVGSRLSHATLQQLECALQGNCMTMQPTLPGTGLVVGIVLDQMGPAENAFVTAGSANIEYVSADRRSLIAPLMGTSKSGIFLSKDAVYNSTTFTAMKGMQMAQAMGGIVDGKVTVVVLQFPPPQSQ